MQLLEENEEPINFDVVVKPTKRPEWKISMENFLENYAVVGFMAGVTIYSLFFDDIRASAFYESADNVFYGITLACMILFMIEIILSSISRVEYFLTFLFWLDVISTISMIPDVGFIWDLMIG